MVTAQISPGGLYRLKTKDELDLHQNNGEEEYIKLKILPSSHDEYRILASYVQNFLKKFGIEELEFSGPDEWSQYLNIEFPDNSQDRQHTIDLINSLGFWACMDGEIGVIDLADIDLNLLKIVFPSILFSFKTERVTQSLLGSVTPLHFYFETLQVKPVSQNGTSDVKEKRPRKPREKKILPPLPEKETPKEKIVEHTNGKTGLSFEDLFTSDVSLPYLPKKREVLPERVGILKTFFKWERSLNSQNLASGINPNTQNLRREYVREALQDPFTTEHRREFVKVIEGVEYWNDSRATNINSVWFTLETIEKPIIWIAGGADKGNDYEPILELVREKVISLILLGRDTSRIDNVFQGVAPEIVKVTSMIHAVQVAYHKAKSGDAIVLSPGCASFDLFENYEDRGRQFKQAVWSL